MPAWIKLFFRATRFWDADRDLWFLSLETADAPAYQGRREYLEAQVAKGYSDSDVRYIAGLLNENAPDAVLAHAIAQVVNQRFFGEEIPRSVTNAAKHTLQEFIETPNVWKYRRARKSQKEIIAYCERTLPPDTHLVDIGHNIGESVQTTAVALRRLKANLNTPVEEIFTQHALTTKTPRIATRSSRLGGLLWVPTVAGKTIFIYRIEKAAAETGDILFTFGAGRRERACVFKDFFIEFMTDLQKALKESAAPSPAPAQSEAGGRG
jgi:hypothetical protein